MSLLWALAGSLAYGVGDLGGAIGARRHAALVVAFAAQSIGLAAAVVLAPFVASTFPTARECGWAALAGVIGALSFVLFLWSLANGPVGVVAPITAVLSVVVPIGFGLADGERPAALAWVGIGVAVVAIVLLARGGADGATIGRHAGSRVILGAMATGVGFGVFYVLFSRTGSGTGLWPVAIARGAAVSAEAVVVVATSAVGFGPAARDRAVWATGLLDVAANAFALFALRAGELSIAPVIIGLYPAFTVALATVVLRERLARSQLVGLAGAAVAIALVAGG